ncbi:hypothetical protein E0Z10_g9944 [Xylaria hypoxylon]|uniref:Uncharacterized protein n=1 Tax=Xylaria hypoxylon TaxID=37992 RepID=A0A4Z0YIQ3_9PEZI|nr:hypothetical protein E0Z10_g9944 [Xylaria hypoxylon]
METQRPASGAMVYVSSIAGLRYIGKPWVAYGAAKAAVMQFAKTTAVVYAVRGVRLNTTVPIGQMGDAWDVANAVLFLVSDEARYITGQKIVVGGGITSSTGRT